MTQYEQAERAAETQALAASQKSERNTSLASERTCSHPAEASQLRTAERLNSGPRVQSLLQMREALNPGPNRTGLPDNLKLGMEERSGLSLDDVRVHYNSSRPASLGALALTQGKDIHVAPGQEQHLAHETWHAVQQKQGRVRPTTQQAGVPINDDTALEREADQAAAGLSKPVAQAVRAPGTLAGAPVIQRYVEQDGYRISQNQQLAVSTANETKDFYATPTAIGRANLLLETQQSPVELQVGQVAPQPLVGMNAVTPINRNGGGLFSVNECIDVADRVTKSGQSHAIYQPAQGDQPTLRKQSAYDIGEINKVAEQLADNPNVTPAEVTSAQEALSSEDEDGNKFQFTFRGVNVDTDSLSDANTALKNVIPNRNLRIALLKEVFGEMYERQPLIQRQLADALNTFLAGKDLPISEERDAEDIKKWDSTLRELLEDAQKLERAQASERYRNLDAQQASTRSAMLGVNASARPEPGESYAIVGARDRTNEELGHLWSFHFAAVVARDGGDSVTLENYNRSGAENANELWYFDMQGPEAQSFHEKHKNTVADAVTLRMGVPATDEMKGEMLQKLSEKLGVPVPESVQGKINQAHTRAQLAAAYADAVEEP